MNPRIVDTRMGQRGPMAALIGLAGLAVLASLAACDKRSPTTPPTPTTDSAASASVVTGVQPHSSDIPASANANGPADGATAVGGMSAQQDSGGAKQGSTPAPTAGDGAASATK